jgi:hypothetical protein
MPILFVEAQQTAPCDLLDLFVETQLAASRITSLPRRFRAAEPGQRFFHLSR